MSVNFIMYNRFCENMLPEEYNTIIERYRDRFGDTDLVLEDVFDSLALELFEEIEEQEEEEACEFYEKYGYV